jgi:hypothetical protein
MGGFGRVDWSEWKFKKHNQQQQEMADTNRMAT